MAIGSAASYAALRIPAEDRNDRVRGERQTSARDFPAAASKTASAASGVGPQRLSKLIASAEAAAVAAVTAPPATTDASKVKTVPELLTGVHFRKPVFEDQGERAAAKTDRPTSNTDTDPVRDTTDASDIAKPAEETTAGAADGARGSTGSGSAGLASGGSIGELVDRRV